MYFHAQGGLHPMFFFRKSQNLIKTIVTGHPNLRHLIGWSVSTSYINISKWTHSSSHLYIIWPQWYHEPCYFSQTLVNAYMYIFWPLGYCVKCSNYLYKILLCIIPKQQFTNMSCPQNGNYSCNKSEKLNIHSMCIFNESPSVPRSVGTNGGLLWTNNSLHVVFGRWKKILAQLKL